MDYYPASFIHIYIGFRAYLLHTPSASDPCPYFQGALGPQDLKGQGKAPF